jgi:MFS family permease
MDSDESNSNLPLLQPSSSTNNENTQITVSQHHPDSGIENATDSDNRSRKQKSLITIIVRPIFRSKNPTNFHSSNNTNPSSSPKKPPRKSMLSRQRKPSVMYPVIIVFLEFFAWGLLTTPMLNQMASTFGDETFLINGIIQGTKGFLSFLSAPIIGAFSDIKGRRQFLLITVFATCLPIPLLVVQPWWFFALVALSGTCSVTYTIVFAYVSDITEEEERNTAFGLVSATFAASLVISPAVGALLEQYYGASLVVLLATMIAFIDILFISLCTPESLFFKKMGESEELDMELKYHKTQKISWDQIDPFKQLKSISKDKTLWMISLATFLSYLPEAGQYSCFMVYLDKVMGFDEISVALFIAWVGILAVISQTVLLSWLTTGFRQKTVILVGLIAQCGQLIVYTFVNKNNQFLIWTSGLVLACSSIVYPAMSGWCSIVCDANQQGVIQGIITGVRGLCMGMGPAMYGVIFHVFGVHLETEGDKNGENSENADSGHNELVPKDLMPGPPFIFAAILVVLAIIVVTLIAEPAKGEKYVKSRIGGKASEKNKPSVMSLNMGEVEYGEEHDDLHSDGNQNYMYEQVGEEESTVVKRHQSTDT